MRRSAFGIIGLLAIVAIIMLGWRIYIEHPQKKCKLQGSERPRACTSENFDLLRKDVSELPLIVPRDVGISGGRDAVTKAHELWQKGFVPLGRKIEPWPFKLPLEWNAAPFTNDNNWRFQLHAWRMLDPLLLAWEQTRDTRYLTEAFSIVFDWHRYHISDGNQSDFDWYDMAVGLRSMKLAYLSQRIFKGDISLNKVERQQLLEIAWRHAENLMDKRYLAKGNHGLFQLHGLLALCRVLPALTSCEGSDIFVETEMRNLLLRQFSEEGVHLESAPEYHFFAYSVVNNFVNTGWYEGFGFIKDLMVRVDQNRIWMLHPDKTIVTVGDSEPKPVNVDWPRDTNVCEQGKSVSCYLLKHFEQSGYAIVRSHWQAPAADASMLFFMGMFFQEGHKHPDDLSFEWFEYGERLLTNAGKYSYSSDPFRDYVTSSAAHNTIEIDGKSFKLAKAERYGSAIEDARRVGEMFVLRGKVNHGKEPVSHHRLIFFRPGHWLVVDDDLTAAQSHRYVQWFHFAPQWRLSHSDDQLRLHSSSGRTVNVSHLSTGELVLARGERAPKMQGWVTESYGNMVDRQSVGFSTQGRNVRLLTVFAFDDAALEQAKKAIESWSGKK